MKLTITFDTFAELRRKIAGLSDGTLTQGEAAVLDAAFAKDETPDEIIERIDREDALEGELVNDAPEASAAPAARQTNVIPMETIEGDTDAEEVVQTAAASDPENEPTVAMFETLQGRFEALIAEDYDAAEAMLKELGVDTFGQAMGAGHFHDLAKLLS